MRGPAIRPASCTTLTAFANGPAADACCRENGELRHEISGLRRAAAAGGGGGGGESGDARAQKLEAESREMKKTIDNLMEVRVDLPDQI